MRKVIIVSFCILLTGCGANQEPLEEWYNSEVLIKSSRTEATFISESKPEIIPVIPFINRESNQLFFPAQYKKNNANSSESACQAMTDSNFVQKESERLAVLLHFRGYLSGKQGIWALVEAQNGNFYRLREGEKLPVEPYRLKLVKAENVVVTGVVPDSYGCSRPVTVTLRLSSGRGQ